jgi:hypothetical protein
MPFIAAGANYTAQVESMIEESRGFACGTLVSFLFANQNFNLLG